MDPELKLKANQPQFENCYSREIPSIRAKNIDENNRTIRGVLATELPAVVFDWSRWNVIREIILIDGVEVPKKMPLLDAHSRFQTANIKGSTVNPEKMEDPKLGRIIEADNVFSATAENEWTLAKEGHLDSTSIGYEIFPDQSIEVNYGTETVIKGVAYKNDYSDKLPLVIRLRSRIFENSLVPIGADKAAKFRSVYNEEFAIKSAGTKELLEEIKKTNQLLELTKTDIEKINQKRSTNMSEIIVDEQAKLSEEKRKTDIEALHKDFASKVKGINLDEMKSLFIQGGKSANEFSDLILKQLMDQDAVAKPTLDLSKAEKTRYSISRAIAYQMNPRAGNCLEAEISDEYKRVSGYKSDGIVIPHTIMDFKRVVNTSSTSGGDFVGTDHLGGEFIDALKNVMVTDKLGVKMLSGRKGNIEIPKLSTGNTFGWAATENAQAGASTPVTTKITMSPKRGGFYVDISKQAIIQSDPSLDKILTDDGVMMMGLGLDAGYFHGTGASGQFSGLEILSNVGSVSGASLDWAAALQFPKQLKTANAGNLGEMKFAFNAAVEAELMGRPKVAGQAIFIIGDDGKLIGRSYVESNQINDGYIFFGAFGQSYIALWDALDVTVDMVTLAREFEVRITFNQLADCAFRYPGAFVVTSDFS